MEVVFAAIAFIMCIASLGALSRNNGFVGYLSFAGLCVLASFFFMYT